jgi:hypothetical protein
MFVPKVLWADKRISPNPEGEGSNFLVGRTISCSLEPGRLALVRLPVAPEIRESIGSQAPLPLWRGSVPLAVPLASKKNKKYEMIK